MLPRIRGGSKAWLRPVFAAFQAGSTPMIKLQHDLAHMQGREAGRAAERQEYGGMGEHCYQRPLPAYEQPAYPQLANQMYPALHHEPAPEGRHTQSPANMHRPLTVPPTQISQTLPHPLVYHREHTRSSPAAFQHQPPFEHHQPQQPQQPLPPPGPDPGIALFRGGPPLSQPSMEQSRGQSAQESISALEQRLAQAQRELEMWHRNPQQGRGS